MKIVRIKNDILLIFLVLLVSCNNDIIKKDFTYSGVVDYDRDSVIYLLDIKGDFKKEKVLVTRQIIVRDSIIGNENENGVWEKMHHYCKELSKGKTDFNCDYKYLYTIFIQEFNKYTKLISYKLDMDNVVILRQGSRNYQFDTFPKSVTGYMRYLRIMNLREEDLNTRSINMYYDEENEKWKILSIERLGINYFRNKKEVKYCIDTISYCPEDLFYKEMEWLEWSRYEDCLENIE
ncbi:hypothetical protein DKB58_03025 [Capnocytophaga canimorsus]|uniref:hypothetical protein n=1 Tax=Capnocytophaga canimorsus TaxID=28188 RepID=UPI000D6DF68D|nr:hypothetical protein [Capnocytophaga canimorsus]AWL77993.1 hypothetical protein DKB58_03025 [Capnocytophaga canimorsus]MDT9499298.1 hypothetical protein [Capnocytophaga canimorsus]